MRKRTTPQWYVIMVQTGKESDVKRNLTESRNGFELKELIVPEPELAKLVKIVKEEEDKYRYRHFKGYIFLKTTLTPDKYMRILNMESVYKFLGICKKDSSRSKLPISVDPKEIRNVREFLTGKNVVKQKTSFSINDEVEIKSGDLAKIRGKIIEMKNGIVKIMPNAFFNNPIKVSVENIISYP